MSIAVFACAVCFSDPESLMAKGAIAGVSFLLIIVVLVLGAIAGTAYRWSRRAKELAKSAP
jgi:hypothetical protein